MRGFKDLSHARVPLSSGGQVVVLDPGSTITAEAQAMLGALYSRSPGSIDEHLAMLEEKGSDKFMSTYYVGYGHKSIGDLGSASVFIEGVSMLAAKAIQDFPLYNGQEVSTRYVDFSRQPFIDPIGSDSSKYVLERWREFYLSSLPELIPVLKERFPFNEEEDKDEKTWEKAVKARAFDIMRAFLPAGASTNVNWTGELRQFADRLPYLRHHPLPEVREIGNAIEDGLIKAYPNSFSLKRYEATEAYIERVQRTEAYATYTNPDEFAFTDSINRGRLARMPTLLSERPEKIELPYSVRDAGTLEFQFLLDFGSFRDIQRQRAVAIPMPLLTMQHGFEQWYLDELPETMRVDALALLREQEERISFLAPTETIAQYYIPMGFRVPVRVFGDLRAQVYLVELRTTRFVHATLRMKATKMAESLAQAYGPSGLVLHLDPEPGRFDVKRGTHDIVRTA